MDFDLDEFLQHQVRLSRLETGGINAVVTPSLNETYKKIRQVLAEYDDIRSQAQLNLILDRINTIVENSGGWDKLEQEHLLPLAEFEAQWIAQYTAQSLDADVVEPTGVALGQAIKQTLLSVESGTAVQTGLWSEFVKRNLDARKNNYNSIIKRGFLRDQTIAQITTQIRNVSNGLLKREAEALARTGYIHYASIADKTFAEQNTDLADEYYYVVTFDSRTTKICRSLDARFNPPSKRFKVGDPKAPSIPLHFNCRTRRLSVPKGTTPQGMRATVGADGGESIKASTSHAAWLRSQTKSFIIESLGEKRAELFINGGLSLDKFTDMSLRPLTLDEIKQKYPRAWLKAFEDK